MEEDEIGYLEEVEKVSKPDGIRIIIGEIL